MKDKEKEASKEAVKMKVFAVLKVTSSESKARSIRRRPGPVGTMRKGKAIKERSKEGRKEQHHSKEWIRARKAKDRTRRRRSGLATAKKEKKKPKERANGSGAKGRSTSRRNGGARATRGLSRSAGQPKKERKEISSVPSDSAARRMAEVMRWTRSWVLWSVKSREGQDKNMR